MNAPSSSPSTALPATRVHYIIGGIAIAVLALIALGIWLDTRNQISQLQRELIQKLAAAEQFNKDSRERVDQARETLRIMELKVNTLESRFAETQNQRLALESLYTELSRSRDERVLAEVEQMLMIASQQIQLARNLKAALVALENADGRLQRADGAQFTHVRRAIQADIAKLKSAPFVDITGMGLRLENIANQVELWPLAAYARPAQDRSAPTPKRAGGGFTDFLREFWEDARDLVRIQRVNQEPTPLLTPAQDYFLKENLKIRLLSARVGLSSQDEASYKADLRQAIEWINRYFEVKDKKVALGLATLTQLSASNVSIELPDIGASVEAVRQDMRVRERGIR